MQTTAPTQSEITETLLRIALEQYREGPAMAQEPIVLRETEREMHAGSDVKLQQEILNCWQALFHARKLIWGYDIDNPSHPFYHFPEWVEHERLPTWDNASESGPDQNPSRT